MDNREEILESFQNITGIDDVGEAFSRLEEVGWDLMTAIQRAIPQEDALPINMEDVPPPSYAAASSSRSTGTLNNLSAATAGSSLNCNRRNSSNITGPDSAFVPVPSPLDDAEIIDLTSDIDLDSNNTRHNNIRTLTFNIHFNQQIYTIQLPSNATVDELRDKITNATNVPKCRQAIRGWPPAKLREAQQSSTQLCNLDLSLENQLILIDMTEEGYIDMDNDEVTQRLDKIFQLNIVKQPSGEREELNFSGSTTILDVKTGVYNITNIQVRDQEWTGWPPGCDSNTTLAQSGIELNHNFILRDASEKNNSKTAVNATANLQRLDDDNSDDDEYEDASDMEFADILPVAPISTHLIPNNVNDEVTGSEEFVSNYIERFGEPHPAFFIGSLEDAIKEACNKPARDRKLLAIYLHHGKSILTNVFCDQLMKNESIIQTFAASFVLYGWDLTFESNKHMFLSSVTACVDDGASSTIRDIELDRLPSILVIGKSRLLGRTSCGILSKIHGNVSLEDLQTRLLDVVDKFKESLSIEIRDEDERAARNRVKEEQDMAYERTLQADMAKEAAKQQKEAAIAAERKRLESEKAEDEARRESIRLCAEQSLSKEPSDADSNVYQIRIKKPDGDNLDRKFYMSDKLQDLLNFIASNGYLIEDYKIISRWPRRDLTLLDAGQTLQSLNMQKQEMLILEER